MYALFPLLIIPVRHPFSQNLLGLGGKGKGGRDVPGDEAPDLCVCVHVRMCWTCVRERMTFARIAFRRRFCTHRLHRIPLIAARLVHKLDHRRRRAEDTVGIREDAIPLHHVNIHEPQHAIFEAEVRGFRRPKLATRGAGAAGRAGRAGTAGQLGRSRQGRAQGRARSRCQTRTRGSRELGIGISHCSSTCLGLIALGLALLLP